MGEDRTLDWPGASCPHWCQGLHLGNDHPDDRVHQGESRALPVVMRERAENLDGALRWDVTSDELEVVVHQHHDESRIWVYIGNGKNEIDLSLESAIQLIQCLTERVAVITLSP